MIKTDQNPATDKPAAAEDAEATQDANTVDLDQQINDAIYREISKAFEYILKYYDLHKRQIEKLALLNPPSIDEDQSDIEN